jgi:hypothetical protein
MVDDVDHVVEINGEVETNSTARIERKQNSLY